MTDTIARQVTVRFDEYGQYIRDDYFRGITKMIRILAGGSYAEN